MPIHCEIECRRVSKDEYHQLDYRIMGIAFEVHNELGRLYDEKVYQRMLAERCREQGVEVQTEVPVRVSHGEYEKIYFVDLIAEKSVLYELKAAEALNPRHRSQALNYLFLTGLEFGKLVNVRPRSVKHEFITRSVTQEERRRVTFVDEGWVDLCDDCPRLRNVAMEIILDWGGFLDVSLYRDAIGYLIKGDHSFLQPVAVVSRGQHVGDQEIPLLNAEIAVNVSAVKNSPNGFERHLHRLLEHTELRALHWINFDRHRVIMKTLQK